MHLPQNHYKIIQIKVLIPAKIIMFESFTILVSGSPTTSQAHLSAMRFIKALFAKQQTLLCVFFYQEATHVANLLVNKPSDEAQLAQRWADLARQYSFELQVCVTAGERRGIIAAGENVAAENQYNENNTQEKTANLHKAFSAVGLAQLALAMNQASRLLHFK